MFVKIGDIRDSIYLVRDILGDLRDTTKKTIFFIVLFNHNLIT